MIIAMVSKSSKMPKMAFQKLIKIQSCPGWHSLGLSCLGEACKRPSIRDLDYVTQQRQNTAAKGLMSETTTLHVHVR